MSAAAAAVEPYGAFIFLAIALVTAIAVGHWIARH